MRRAVIIALFVLAWTIGPVARIPETAEPAPSPEPTVTATIGG